MAQKNIPFIIFFVYVIFQGALRKWYLPSLGTPLYLFQYVLLYYFYLSSKNKIHIRHPKFTPAFNGLLMVYVVYGLLEILNISGTSNLIVQVYGFAMHFSFVPLMYFMSKAMVDETTFEWYIKWLAYLLIPIFALGFVQYFSPQTAFINRYATDQEDGTYEVAIGAGGRVRIAGTFAYLTPYASFLGFALHLVFNGLLLSLIKNKLNLIFAVALGMGIINIFMTGSRGAVVIFGIVESLVVTYLILTGEAKFIKKLMPLSLILLIGFFAISNTEVGTTAADDFFRRLFGLNDLDGRVNDTLDPFKFLETSGPIGFGIGTAQFPMEKYLTNRSEMPGYWEEESERIVIELGVVGFIIIMALRLFVFISCFRILQSIKKIEYKLLAIQMTFFQAPFLINMQTNIFNYIDGMSYWMAVGLVYFAYTMDRMDKQKNQLVSTTQFGSV